MTEHLPECPMKPIAEAPVDFYQVFPDCICGPLRSCEERVERAVMHAVDVGSYELGQRDCKETHPALALKEITRIASKGYDAGLDAAREAVAAIHDDCNCYEDLGIRAEAIAAIDALREKR